MIPSLTYVSSCGTVCVAKEVTRMAKYTFESIMYGEKYNIESDVFMAAYELVKQGVKPTNIREQLREFYVREAIKTTIKMIKEGDSISDIPEFESLSLREGEK